MRTRYLLVLSVCLAGFVSSAAQGAEAPRTPAPKVTAPVSATDLFCGLFGQEVISTAKPQSRQTYSSKSQLVDLDRRAYLIWKQSNKS
jgi:hypothetical protein